MSSARAEGELVNMRDVILEALEVRLTPTLADYRRIEKVLVTINDRQRLDAIFRLALRAPDFATFDATWEQASVAESTKA